MGQRYLLVAVFAIATIIPFQCAYPQSTQEKAPPQSTGFTLMVPVNTTIPLTLKNTINSRTTQPGQAIYCETIFPITVGNRIVIPVGSSVKVGYEGGSPPACKRQGTDRNPVRDPHPQRTTRPLRATLSGLGGPGGGIQTQRIKDRRRFIQRR